MTDSTDEQRELAKILAVVICDHRLGPVHHGTACLRIEPCRSLRFNDQIAECTMMAIATHVREVRKDCRPERARIDGIFLGSDNGRRISEPSIGSRLAGRDRRIKVESDR